MSAFWGPPPPTDCGRHISQSVPPKRRSRPRPLFSPHFTKNSARIPLAKKAFLSQRVFPPFGAAEKSNTSPGPHSLSLCSAPFRLLTAAWRSSTDPITRGFRCRNDSVVCLSCLLVTLVSRNLQFTSVTKSSRNRIRALETVLQRYSSSQSQCFVRGVC